MDSHPEDQGRFGAAAADGIQYPEIRQPDLSGQLPDASTSSASSVPSGLMPQPPSRTFSQKQSSLRASQLRPLSPERNVAPFDTSMDATAAQRLPRRSTQNSQVLRQSQGLGAGQRSSRNQAVPPIPRWVPPHPTFSEAKQIDGKSIAAGGAPGISTANKSLVEKPSR